MVVFYYNMVLLMSFETISKYFIHIIRLCNRWNKVSVSLNSIKFLKACNESKNVQ